jgi:hypothetical protein
MDSSGYEEFVLILPGGLPTVEEPLKELLYIRRADFLGRAAKCEPLDAHRALGVLDHHELREHVLTRIIREDEVEQEDPVVVDADLRSMTGEAGACRDRGR